MRHILAVKNAKKEIPGEMCLHVFFLTFSGVRLYFACNVASEATLIFSAVLLVGLPGGRRRFGRLRKAAAQSFVMGNARDIGTTFLDEKGRFVSVSAYLPIHVFGAHRQIQAILEKFGRAFKPGDLIIGNDPYIVAASHLPDWIFVRPAFYKDEVVGSFYLRGHMADTGGFQPGGYAAGAFDMIAEGMNIPPIKFLDGGKENVPLGGLLFRNLRNPQQKRMDIFSIAGALQASCDGLARLCDKYGLEMVKATMEEMLSMGERAIRAEISKMQDGEYYGDRACDWDGQTDRQVHVRCKVTVAGGELTIDLSESDPQCEFVNSPEGNRGDSVPSVKCFQHMDELAMPENGRRNDWPQRQYLQMTRSCR